MFFPVLIKYAAESTGKISNKPFLRTCQVSSDEIGIIGDAHEIADDRDAYNLFHDAFSPVGCQAAQLQVETHVRVCEDGENDKRVETGDQEEYV